MSVKEKDIIDYNNHHIFTAYDTTAQSLAAKIHFKPPLLDQIENSMTQRSFPGTIKP